MNVLKSTRDFLDRPFNDGIENMDAFELALIAIFVVTIAVGWKHFVLDYFE